MPGRVPISKVLHLPVEQLYGVYEEILDEKNSSFAHEVTDTELWDLYQMQLSCIWHVVEIVPSRDEGDWEKLPENVRRPCSYILAFFATSDGIVFQNIGQNFGEEVQILEAKYTYAFQAFMENVHAEVYMNLLKGYVKDPEHRRHLTRAVTQVPTIAGKAQWAMEYMARARNPFSVRLLAYAIVEGVFFCGSFCFIFWLRKYHKGVLGEFTLSNEFIARDESMHTEFAVALFHRLKHRPHQAAVEVIMRKAVELEGAFIRDALSTPLINMNADKMTDYVRFVADRLLVSLGYSKMFHTANPFDFMESQSLRVTTNFFESKVSEYQKTDATTYSDSASF